MKKGQTVELAPLLPKVSREKVKAIVLANESDDAGAHQITFALTYFGVRFREISVQISPEGEQKWQK